MTVPSWQECRDAGMSRRQAAEARGVTYDAARRWEWRTAQKFANGADLRKFQPTHLAAQRRVARALRWAQRHNLCPTDLGRVIGMAPNNVAKHAKRHGIQLKRAYGSWHTNDANTRILAAIRGSFCDGDIPPEAKRLIAAMTMGETS